MSAAFGKFIRNENPRPGYWHSAEHGRCGFRANTVSQFQIASVRIRTAPGTWRSPVLTLPSADFSSAENPHVHFLSSACGHNKDVFYCRVELTRRGHNFNCAAGAAGSFYLGRRPHPNGFFAASDCLENGSSESETGVVLRRSRPHRPSPPAAFRAALAILPGSKSYWLSRSHFSK
jgi:hypothetical protein